MKQHLYLFLSICVTATNTLFCFDFIPTAAEAKNHAMKHAGKYAIAGTITTLALAIASSVVRAKQDKAYRLKKALKNKRLELKRLLSRKTRQAPFQTSQEKIDSLASNIEVQALIQAHSNAKKLAQKAETIFHRLVKAALFIGGATGVAAGAWWMQKAKA